MIEVCKGTNLSVFLQRIKQKEEMENKKPIVLNNLEEWDFTDYIDSLIQKEEAVDLEFKVAKDGLPNSLWDTYSSFANTDGGVIVLGVKEHKQQFIIRNGIRIDETPTHIAVREAFINTLIHCDFSEEGNIVVEQWVDKYRFKNPGTMLVSKAQYYLGGDSVCRNKALQKMFMLIGFSEKAGSGVNKIIKGWREANWQKPYVEEFSRPDKVELTLPMISLLPDDAVIKLKELFDGKVENLTQDELTALVTCYSEGGINNTQLQYVIPQHRSDITKMLKKLCNQGFLISEGNRRGTKYHVNDPERKVGSSEEKVGSSEEKVGSSKRLKFEELQSIIISIAEDYITLDEIAKRTNRTFDYIANKIIPRMLKNGTIEYLYPGVPNHPKQKYKATNKKTNNKQ